MSKTDLVSQGYFSSESFFQFIPTEDGLKLPAPPLNILTKEKDGSTIYYLEKIDNKYIFHLSIYAQTHSADKPRLDKNKACKRLDDE